MLKEIPHDERPREKLLAFGAQSLLLCELLAILIGSGTQERDAHALAKALLKEFTTLEALIEAGVEQLNTISGLGPAKVATIKAALELARRAQKPMPRMPINRSEDVCKLVHPYLYDEGREQLFVLLLDVRSRLIALERIGLGIANSVLVHPREVFLPAVRKRASGIILVHTHPSGDPTPSKADKEVTKVLYQASRIMGISLEDHLIVTQNSHYSFKAHGLLIT